MKFFEKHNVLAAQTNSLWYESASCVSPNHYNTLMISYQIYFNLS